MCIRTYVTNVFRSRKIQHELALLFCFCVLGIVLLSVKNDQVELHLTTRAEETFSVNIYSIVSNTLPTLKNLSTATLSPTTEESLRPQQALSLKPSNLNKSKTKLWYSNVSKINNSLRLNDSLGYKKQNKQRVPVIDNTANFRVPVESSKILHNGTLTASSISNADVSKALETEQKSNQTLVLLITYLRSGSTFTADLIQQASNVFYLYEPLKPYIRDQHFFTLDSVCHTINGTCRKQKGRQENIDHVLNDLAKFYNCDLFRVPITYFRFSNKSSTMLQFDKCRHYNTQYKCLLEFQEKCKKSIRMIKTIRMNMDVAERLMEEFPSLKVIHLIRDPRGSYQSRRNGYFLRDQNNLSAITKSNCDTLHSDLKTGFRLHEMYPGRIKTLLYEQVAEAPLKASRSIFRFLGLTEPANFDSWLVNHTRAGYSNGYYDTVRRNSKTTASLWRKYINLNVVKSYDNSCKEVYDILGLNTFDKYTTLHNYAIPSWRQSPVFGNFLD